VEIFLVCPEHAFVDGKSLWMVFFVHVYVHGVREHYVKTVCIARVYDGYETEDATEPFRN
jgi:hypothetical protein